MYESSVSRVSRVWLVSVLGRGSKARYVEGLWMALGADSRVVVLVLGFRFRLRLGRVPLVGGRRVGGVGEGLWADLAGIVLGVSLDRLV